MAFMKYWTRAMLTMCLLVLVGSWVFQPGQVQAHGENLITNADFEASTNNVPDNWLQGGYGTNTAVFSYPVVGQDGLSAARVEMSSYADGDAKWYFSPVAVTPGVEYTYSDWYRADVETQIVGRYTLTNGSNSYFLAADHVPASTTWTQAGITFTPPVDVAAVTFFHLLYAVGYLELDNVALTESLIIPPTTSLVPNFTFHDVNVNGNPDQWSHGAWGANTRTFTYPVTGIDDATAARVDISAYTSGDAKWYFKDVAVNAGTTYTLQHAYRSDSQTDVTVRYTTATGSQDYVGIASLAPASDWTVVTDTIVIPNDVVSMTVFHSLTSVGWLEVDKYLLTTGALDAFDHGMVSLSFDDGWLSQYTNAAPILDAANVKGTFYIVSDYTQYSSDEEYALNPSFANSAVAGMPDNWSQGSWGDNQAIFSYPVAGNGDAFAARVEMTAYTSGDAKWFFDDVTVFPGADYIIKDKYNATVPTDVVIRYKMTSGAYQYVYAAGLPATAGQWVAFSKAINIPDQAESMTVFHILSQVGQLDVDDYSVKLDQAFMTTQQMLALQQSGHEIGGHAKTHADLPTLDSVQLFDEVSTSRQDLLALGALPMTTMAYPYGRYNATVQTAAQDAGFVIGRSVDRGFNVTSTDKFALKIQQVDRTTTLTELQGWVQQAVADKTWLILMYHQVDDDPTTIFGSSPALLQQLVDYLNAQAVNVVTVQEGAALMP